MTDTFYRSFRERRLTAFGASRRRRIEQSRLALLHRFAGPPGDLVEIGPGDGSLAAGRSRRDGVTARSRRAQSWPPTCARTASR